MTKQTKVKIVYTKAASFIHDGHKYLAEDREGVGPGFSKSDTAGNEVAFVQKVAVSSNEIIVPMLPKILKEKEEEPAPKETALSEEEKQRAEEILRSENLMEQVHAELDKRVVGEKVARQTVFLVACGALYIRHSKPAANNLLLNADSSAGKDYVVSSVLLLFPQECVIKRTRISPTALTYWHNSMEEPDWTWDYKILYLADVSNNVLNCEVLKVMVTDGSKATVTIQQQAVDIEIRGKPGVIATIASAQPTDETLTRFPIASLDESVDQTEAIMFREAASAESGQVSHQEYSADIRNALRLLAPVDVVVPFARQMAIAFPARSVIMRRHFSRLLQYVRASTALHQRSREKSAGGAVIATRTDYENARVALVALTSNSQMIPLTSIDRKLLEAAAEIAETFSVREVQVKVPDISQRSLYDHLGKLAKHGLLETSSETRDGVYQQVTVYRHIRQKNHVPTWDEMIDAKPAKASGAAKDAILSAFEAFADDEPDSGGRLSTSYWTVWDSVCPLFDIPSPGSKPDVLFIDRIQNKVPEATDEWLEWADEHQLLQKLQNGRVLRLVKPTTQPSLKQ